MPSGGGHSQQGSQSSCKCSLKSRPFPVSPVVHVEWRFNLGQAELLLLAGRAEHFALTSFTYLSVGYHEPPEHPPKTLV